MLPEVELKNGGRVPEPVARVLPLLLQRLAQSDPIAFYELVMLARNPKHKVWSDAIDQKLQSLAFLDAPSHVQNTARQIILSAVEGESLDMRIVDPVKA